MKELKVILSPHFSEEEFYEEVSGINFTKGTGLTTFSINLEEHKLSGVQSALRKNILLPFDKATNDFVNGRDISALGVKEVVVEAPVEPVVEVSAKKTRKRTTKKDTE